MSMKLQIEEFGTEQNLQLVSVNRETPKYGEVEVKVEASSLAFTDTLLRRGIYPGMKKDLPLTLGYDFVGRIENIGDGVANFKIGDRVGALTISGANAEYVIHRADDLFPVPKQVVASEAENLILSWVTAYQMLFREAKSQPGDTILVHGAAGGVGHALVRLARLYQINVIATSKPADFEALKKEGVKLAFDYKDRTLWQKLKAYGAYDAIFDGVSETNFRKSYGLLSKKGVLVCFGFSAKGKGVTKTSRSIGFLSLIMVIKTIYFLITHTKARFYDIKRAKVAQPKWFQEDIQILLDLLRANKITTQTEIVHFSDLHAIRQAHKRLTEGGVRGRISLVHEPQNPSGIY